MATATIKTREEVDDLKWQWAESPIWDIEDTEGFDGYRDELLHFSIVQKAEWKQAAHDRLVAFAEEWGIPGNLRLAEHIQRLERRVADLEQKSEGR